MHWILYVLLVIAGGILLWLLHSKVEQFVSQTDPKLTHIWEMLRPMFTKKDFTGLLACLNDRNILDELDIYTGNKSYSINKETIYLCLTDPDTGKYYNDNMLVYVALHEISHCLCLKCIDHDVTYKQVFAQLLDRAEAYGVYDSSIPLVQNYCGSKND